MDYRTLGRTGVKVSPHCLGAMMFGAWGNPDHDDSTKIIFQALEAGINFLDSADVYSSGESERIVGEALSGERREGDVLATKAHGPMGLTSQLSAALITLDADVLDRIDEIVAPGTTLDPGDAGYAPPETTDASLRRRS
jgi:aryl-alcohol dehydrogenase-like predicted oxidoreductase